MEFQLKQTTDYSIFKRANNRFIDPKDVERKKRDILKRGLQQPLIVNSRYELVDGQHRLRALMELGEKVHYIVSSNWNSEEDTAAINNMQKSWNTENWAQFVSTREGGERVANALPIAKEYCRLSGNKMTVTTALEMLYNKRGFSILPSIKEYTYDYNAEIADKVFKAALTIAKHPASLKNPFNQKLIRCLKNLYYDRGYINMKALDRMASKEYLKSYNNEGDMYKYLKALYNKYN